MTPYEGHCNCPPKKKKKENSCAINSGRGAMVTFCLNFVPLTNNMITFRYSILHL